MSGVNAYRCGRFPPEVRTAIPVEGRFEHIVLSCNTTSDHGIIWIEREAQKALEVNGQNTPYILLLMVIYKLYKCTWSCEIKVVCSLHGLII